MIKTIIISLSVLFPLNVIAYQQTQNTATKKEIVNPLLVVYKNPFKMGMPKKEIISTNKSTLKELQEQRNSRMKPVLDRFNASKAIAQQKVKAAQNAYGTENGYYYDMRSSAYKARHTSEQNAKRVYLSERKIVMDSYDKAKKQLEADYKKAAQDYKQSLKKN